MEDFYYPGPHFIYGEFEHLDQPWGRDLPDYRYFGYAKATAGVSICYSQIDIKYLNRN